MDNHATYSLAALALIVSCSFLLPRQRLNNTPPIIHLSDEILFRRPREAYESALKRYGSIIGVYRKNRLEYIVDESHTPEVLVNDALFSAERGTAAILNLPILNLLPYSFIGVLDKLVNKSITPSLENLIARLCPIFQANMFKLAAQADNAIDPVPVDLVRSVHEAMAESMLLLIVGEKNPGPELIEDAIKVSFSIAVVSGIYQNVGYWSRTFPTTWRIIIWIRLMIFTIPWAYRRIAWRIFKNLQEVRRTGNTDHLDPDCLVYHLVKDSGHIPGVMQSIWFLCLTLGLFFASIHQTSVVVIWVLYEMAVRRDIIPALREELSNILEVDCDSGEPGLTYASLRKAEHLDSFIREVFRTKGDTLSIVRLTTQNVPLGRYLIPKGSLVIPLATLSHESVQNWGEDSNKFMGDRWVATDKTAASISTSYWPFGLGRYACPGRFLATAEIKLIVLSLISRVDIFLEGGKYEVVDPMNTVSVPPSGKFLICPLEKPIL